MKRPLSWIAAGFFPLSMNSCAPTSGSTGDPRQFPYHALESNVPHAPKLKGYRQLPSRSTAMRDAEIDHPTGKWTYSYDVNATRKPLIIRTASGKIHRLGDDYYPSEGGADAAGVYAFAKGDETVVVLQGTSDFTYEETHITFQGENLIGAKKYGTKGLGMGSEAPGIAPKHPVYPPR